MSGSRAADIRSTPVRPPALRSKWAWLRASDAWRARREGKSLSSDALVGHRACRAGNSVEVTPPSAIGAGGPDELDQLSCTVELDRFAGDRGRPGLVRRASAGARNGLNDRRQRGAILPVRSHHAVRSRRAHEGREVARFASRLARRSQCDLVTNLIAKGSGSDRRGAVSRAMPTAAMVRSRLTRGIASPRLGASPPDPPLAVQVHCGSRDLARREVTGGGGRRSSRLRRASRGGGRRTARRCSGAARIRRASADSKRGRTAIVRARACSSAFAPSADRRGELVATARRGTARSRDDVRGCRAEGAVGAVKKNERRRGERADRRPQPPSSALGTAGRYSRSTADFPIAARARARQSGGGDVSARRRLAAQRWQCRWAAARYKGA